MQISEELKNFPMGPKLGKWLGIDQENMTDFDHSKKGEFNDFILRFIEDAEVKSEDSLVELIDELVSMDLPNAALKLADYQASIWTRKSFRGTQAEGIAAMITGDLGRAELCFKHAHHASPEEPAPFTNLVQVLYHDDRLDDADVWLNAGLNTNPNYYRLWELVFAVEQKRGHEQEVINKKVYDLAKELNSWAGYSLAAETDLDANSQTKAHNLSSFYSQGERDVEFLIEYTGALGAAGDLEKIPHIFWEANKAASGKELPWRLEMHAAQAYLSMGRHEEFIERAKNILGMKYIPEEVSNYLNQLLGDAEKELTEAKEKSSGAPSKDQLH
jgi:Flp pilus assembly protein TadD